LPASGPLISRVGAIETGLLDFQVR